VGYKQVSVKHRGEIGGEKVIVYQYVVVILYICHGVLVVSRCECGLADDVLGRCWRSDVVTTGRMVHPWSLGANSCFITRRPGKLICSIGNPKVYNTTCFHLVVLRVRTQILFHTGTSI
jgi:hypothetical protein